MKLRASLASGSGDGHGTASKIFAVGPPPTGADYRRERPRTSLGATL